MAYGEGSDFHISLYDYFQEELQYNLYSTAGPLETEVVTAQVTTASRPVALAISPDQSKHICYVLSSGRFEHAWQSETGEEWIKSSPTYYGTHCSVAVDENGQPHLAYYLGGTLKHAWGTWNSGDQEWGWQTESLEYLVSPPNMRTGIAVEESGSVHIAYSGGNWYKHAYGEWVSDGVWAWTVTNTPGSDPSTLVLDDNGPHLVIVGSVGTGHAWAVWEDTEWVWYLEEVDTAASGSRSLTISQDGTLHIAYSTGYTMKYAAATYDAGVSGWSWETDIVDDPEEPGVVAFPSIVVDEFGSVYIAYSDITNGTLKLAHN